VFLRNVCWLSMESTKPYYTVVHGTRMIFIGWNPLMLTRKVARLTLSLIVSLLLCGLLLKGPHIESEYHR
jgi:hypothetical protein